MSAKRIIKPLLVCGAVAAAILWLAEGSSSQNLKSVVQTVQTKPATYSTVDYIGGDACKDCHEDQFKAFSHTSHAQLPSRCGRRV